MRDALKQIHQFIRKAKRRGATISVEIKRDPRSPRHYLRSCKGKVRYGQHKTALLACGNMAKKGAQGLEAYQCEFCGGWHIGHPDQALAMADALRKLVQ